MHPFFEGLWMFVRLVFYAALIFVFWAWLHPVLQIAVPAFAAGCMAGLLGTIIYQTDGAEGGFTVIVMAGAALVVLALFNWQITSI